MTKLLMTKLLMTKLLFIAVLIIVGGGMGWGQAATVSAQTAPRPHIIMFEQVITDGMVWVERAYSAGDGWVAIQADNAGPGQVLGYAPVHAGYNDRLFIPIDTTPVTPTLYAVLYSDAGILGEFEVGGALGADLPVVVDDLPIAPSFTSYLIDAKPQFVTDSVAVDRVVIDQDGWLVVTTDDRRAPGGVLGYVALSAGTHADVRVPVAGDVTGQVWVVLHQDSDTIGSFEYGQTETADLPLMASAEWVAASVATTPIILAQPQLVLPSDAALADGAPLGTTITIRGVLSASVGWLVIYANYNGERGGIIGFAALQAGYNNAVAVTIRADALSARVWAVLHEDTGVVGSFDFDNFGTFDSPVLLDGSPVQVNIPIAPTIVNGRPQPLQDNVIIVQTVVAEGPSWVVVLASVDGQPGPVVGFAPVNAGMTRAVAVRFEDLATVAGAATQQVFLALHADDHTVGQFEFATIEGADRPVVVNGSPVVARVEVPAQ